MHKVYRVGVREIRLGVTILLVLEHEPDNPYDINAIRVLRQNGEQIGYLEREFAGEVVSRSAKGRRYHAVIAGIGRPQAPSQSSS
jgi:hypothetical protein